MNIKEMRFPSRVHLVSSDAESVAFLDKLSASHDVKTFRIDGREFDTQRKLFHEGYKCWPVLEHKYGVFEAFFDHLSAGIAGTGQFNGFPAFDEYVVLFIYDNIDALMQNDLNFVVQMLIKVYSMAHHIPNRRVLFFGTGSAGMFPSSVDVARQYNRELVSEKG